MSSEIRVNKINNRSGLSTVTFTNTGPIISGVTTFQDKVDFESNGLNVTSGSVGIGTDNPDRLLHLGSTGAPVIKISDYDTGVPAPSYAEMSFNGGNMVFSADAGNVSGSTLVAFEIDGSEKLRIESSGRVGIGTDDPATEFHVQDGSDLLVALFESPNNNVRLRIKSSSSSFGQLEFADDTDADAGEIRYAHTTDRMTFHVGNNTQRVGITSETDGTGNLEIANGNLVFSTSGTGIDFSATTDATGMDSELLDDYEEGTFTMTMSCGGNTANQECRYTKIGRIVYIDGHGDEVTNNFFNTSSQSAGTSATITTNLPFTPVRTGAAPITVSRTLRGANGFDYERMYVGWRKDSAAIYLGSESNHYMPQDNVVTTNTQTNKTILFSGHFVTEV